MLMCKYKGIVCMYVMRIVIAVSYRALQITTTRLNMRDKYVASIEWGRVEVIS